MSTYVFVDIALKGDVISLFLSLITAIKTKQYSLHFLKSAIIVNNLKLINKFMKNNWFKTLFMVWFMIESRVQNFMNEEEKKIIEEEGLYFVEPDKKEKRKNYKDKY